MHHVPVSQGCKIWHNQRMEPQTPDSSEWQVARCHCGALRLKVRLTQRQLLACNCSICTQKGFLHLIVGRDDVRIESNATQVEYRFGSKTARHFHCSTCGITPYYVPRSHPDGYSINARCLEGFDITAFEVTPFDGQNWEQNIASIR